MKDALFLSAPQPLIPVSPDANDIVFVDGDMALIDGPARKFQDIAKILLTRIGSDPIFPTYGSQIPNVIGQRDIAVDDQISDGVVQAMAFLNTVETSNAPGENIRAIRSLVVKSPGNDPREKAVYLDVALEDGTVVQTNVRI